jgi:hypothetical protein
MLWIAFVIDQLCESDNMGGVEPDHADPNILGADHAAG